MPEFTFDPNSQRYRVISGPNKGKFISYEAIVSLTERYIEQSRVEVDDITNSLLNRSISVSEWEEQVALELREAHTNSYALGHGGIGRLGDREKAEISDRIKDEFQYLRGFSEDILSGTLLEAQIRDRTSMYVDSLHRSFQMGRESSHYDAGYDEERRVIGSNESCQDCISYEAMGWQAIGSLPYPGEESQCLSRCRCYKEFRKSEEQNSYRLLSGQGWLQGEKRMSVTRTEETEVAIANKMNEPLDSMSETSETLIKNVGKPTAEQIAMINQHSPMGDLSADEVTTLAFYASNNLLRHNNAAWTMNALSNMGELLIGRKFIFNHDWDDVGVSRGKIYDYQLLYSEDAPDAAINQVGHTEINDYIVSRAGYLRLVLHVYFENGSQILNDFRFGRLDDVSTGTLGNLEEDYICPVCSERYGRNVRFFQKDEDGLKICPHDIPTPFMLWWFGDDPDANFAPFYYQDLNQSTGGHGVELSAVVIPNLPATGIITPKKMELVG